MAARDKPAAAPRAKRVPALVLPPYSGGVVGLFESPDTVGRSTRVNLSRDIATLLGREKFRLLLSDAGYIAQTFDIVSGGLEQKSDYVCQAGFTPHFAGEDEAWGKLARAALVEAHASVNARGPLWSWDVAWKIASIAPDIHGDCFVIFGQTADGYPQLQFLEAHRVGQRGCEKLVADGPYAGRPIINGIIYDELGAEIAYRVLGATAADDADIDAASMLHVAMPRWFSDGRPFPTIAASLLSLYDVKETRGFQRTKAKVNSKLTLTEETPDGKPPGAMTAGQALAQNQAVAAARAAGTAAPPALGAPGNPVIMDLGEGGGLIRYIKSGAGKLTSHADNTPADGWLRFDERLIQGAFYGMKWRSEMLDLSKLGGAAVRGFADQINTVIYERWIRLVPFILRAELYVLSRLIAIGRVPAHPEWMKWFYVPPAEFTVDQGRAAKADIDAVRAGADTMPRIIGRYGRTAEEALEEQAKYLKLKASIEAKHGLAPGSLGSLAQPGLAPAPETVVDPTLEPAPVSDPAAP